MTDDGVRQRRGEKSGGDSATTTTVASSDHQQMPSPDDQMKNAHAKIVMTKMRTAELHASWRGHLFRLSLLIVIISLHQAQVRSAGCIREIKASSGGEGGNDVGGYEAMQLILGESSFELVGVVISFLLAYFLALGQLIDAPLSMDTWPYLLSSVLVPMQLGMFYHNEPQGCFVGGADPASFGDLAPTEIRQFPVGVVYHTIISLAVWFMKMGMDKCEENVDLVEVAMRELSAMNENMKIKAARIDGLAKKRRQVGSKR